MRGRDSGMDLLKVILRIVHIASGVYWTGMIWFFALFFLPRIKEAGPEGSRVMGRITAPPFPQLTSWAAGLVSLTGIWMYWLDSAGFSVAWIQTPTGIVIAVGGLAGLLAFGEGLMVSRPAALRLAALGKEAAAAGGQPTPAQAAEMQQLGGRLERVIYRAAYLLGVAVLAMAAARYL